jgi:O-acetyl-ADP-ribose deacetylase (regulator of RNase III)
VKSIDRENLLSERGIRFGRTIVLPSAESLFSHQVDAIVYPANRRGLMGVGIAGVVRAEGGHEIERQVMERAPMTLGTVEVTTAGRLAERGTRAIIHAVVADALGAPAREDTIRDATPAVRETADRERYRSIAMPVLSSGQLSSPAREETIALVMIEEIVAHLRRFASRLDRIVLICNDEREVRILEHALADARRMWWGLQV